MLSVAKCSVPSLESLVIEMQQSKIGSAVFPSISSLSSHYHQPELYLKISIQKKKASGWHGNFVSKGDVQNQHGGVAVFKLLLAIPLKGAYHDRHTLVLAVLSSAELQVWAHLCRRAPASGWEGKIQMSFRLTCLHGLVHTNFWRNCREVYVDHPLKLHDLSFNSKVRNHNTYGLFWTTCLGAL